MGKIHIYTIIVFEMQNTKNTYFTYVLQIHTKQTVIMKNNYNFLVFMFFIVVQNPEKDIINTSIFLKGIITKVGIN